MWILKRIETRPPSSDSSPTRILFRPAPPGPTGHQGLTVQARQGDVPGASWYRILISWRVG